ncbi:uncharacterized protein LOC118738544 [Rhagoletis pomonella]|uniref:uncharacterized protein LOC118738544 n=1 Tax=Rhagoletis pomonella TaxID=28610 RepID=UPI00177E4D3D|nr:uncharacterized protein LOC118738544 [Rhagoletis pomonella]
MKCIILFSAIVILATLAIDTSYSSAATSKPFVRSRYSKRWRIVLTTESNASNNTLTTDPQNAFAAGMKFGETTTVNNVAIVGDTTTIGHPVEVPSTKSIDSKSTLLRGPHSTTTEHPRHHGPNGLPLDYDYYSNGSENEEEPGHK